MGRLVDRVPWLKKLGPVWKVLDAFDTVAGLWERIPGWAKGWLGRVGGIPIYWAIWTWASHRVGAWLDFGTRNWPLAILIGLLLAAVTWALIEALRYRSMQRTIRARVDHEGRPMGEVTIVEPVYVPEDHAKPSGGDQPVEIVTALSKFMEEAQALHKWAEDRERPEGDLIRTSNEWHGRIQDYLETHLGRDYRVRLHIHHGMERYGGSYPKFSKERIELCKDLDFDIRR